MFCVILLLCCWDCCIREFISAIFVCILHDLGTFEVGIFKNGIRWCLVGILWVLDLKGKIYMGLILGKQDLRDYSISRFAMHAKHGLLIKWLKAFPMPLPNGRPWIVVSLICLMEFVLSNLLMVAQHWIKYCHSGWTWLDVLFFLTCIY